MKKEYKIGLAIVVLIALYLGYLGVRVGPISIGDASNSIFTSHASSTQFTMVAGTVYQIAATSTVCSARIVTASTGVALTFNDQPLTATTNGHWLAASSTPNDGNFAGKDFGCGVMRARANAAGVLTITEEN